MFVFRFSVCMDFCLMCSLFFRMLCCFYCLCVINFVFLVFFCGIEVELVFFDFVLCCAVVLCLGFFYLFWLLGFDIFVLSLCFIFHVSLFGYGLFCGLIVWLLLCVMFVWFLFMCILFVCWWFFVS